ncbi:thiol:disulfide interchange protein DsbA/DsbL [Shewanella abyssi]|uniref:thiol:disulfide interchange protein DsbA/DsbL n=1 Tax=Shewanella abyssi TaxID=311789 RepID=UPI00200C6E92|nr:thiol:disulfide interchange protein DsbA/DsbL [Shewanella abyssi]MCL1049691.1 thiol:disulfide interchange protein DsbA/DsbL [Shewanella abyssi]
MKKRLALLLFALVMSGCSDNSSIEADGNYVEGVHYKALATPVSNQSQKVSVMEFFAYSCPHCELFEKPLHHWQQNIPEGVELVQIPAVWNEPMKLYAKVFYIGQGMQQKDKVHAGLFPEIMALRKVPSLEQQQAKLGEFLSLYGLSRAEFSQKISSPEVERKLQNAMELMSQAKIEGTPSIVVNGRYLVLNKSAKSAEQVMDIANYLVSLEKARLAAQ